jgi:protease-4
MIAFLNWSRGILAAVLNGIAKAVVLLVLIVLVLVVIGLARGDGLPPAMILTLDLRQSIADSDTGPAGFLRPRAVTVMDIVLGLEQAEHDARVKGVELKLGGGSLSVAQAEEISTALARLRGSGKFVVAQASSFSGAGLGDYLAAAAANQIWVQPKSPFSVSGTGGGEIFLRGLLDKIQAKPEIAKRADYKSAADMYMEKSMTAPDREQLTVLMQSVYDSAVRQMAAARHLSAAAVVAALEQSPQFAEEAASRRLVDRIGYDDDARAAELKQAGDGAKPVKLADYLKTRDMSGRGANIALVEASGEIVDGTAKNSLLDTSSDIASDDLSAAIKAAVDDKDIKAIIIRVDSPGGSVTASDQILHAVKKAQIAGKPVVISMGSVAASGGYYISTSANRIVAEPGTITGSIGVLTGKVSFDKSLALIGVGAGQVAVGKNTLMDSPLQPFTPDQWAALNHQADVIYADFKAKVGSGRKLTPDQVEAVAKGRVWSGADARTHGLVDELGGFWTAAGAAAQLGHIPPHGVIFKLFPRHKGVLEGLQTFFMGGGESLASVGHIDSILRLPAVQAVLGQVQSLPRGGVELRAVNLPR